MVLVVVALWLLLSDGTGRYAHQEERAALAMLSSSCLVEICRCQMA